MIPLRRAMAPKPGVRRLMPPKVSGVGQVPVEQHEGQCCRIQHRLVADQEDNGPGSQRCRDLVDLRFVDIDF